MSAQATTVRQWTEPQRAAIAHRRGNLLVSAAAGSGKTAVLAERCARLISDGAAGGGPRTGVENLLVLTFTEAAAAEMRTRIAGALAEKLLAAAPGGAQGWLRRQVAMVDRAGISTLHAFCMRILRQHFHEAQVDPAFEIVDQEEAQLLQEETLDDLLARWHGLPKAAAGGEGGKAGPLTAETFGEFFEAYAQGSPAICRQLVLGLHRMLASTAFPDAYIAASRGLYGAGAAATFAAFNREVLGGQVGLARLAAQRGIADLARHSGTAQMSDALNLALRGLDDVAAVLAEGSADYSGLWQRARRCLDTPWPKRITTIKEIADFETLKDRSYKKIKERIGDLAEVFTRDPAAMLRDLNTLAKPLETLLEMTRQFDAAFTAAKRADNRLDFADLERLAFELLMRPGSLARAELQQRYHFVLVDEFQDINPLQAGLLEAVSLPASAHQGGNLFVVGDIKQSIYAFRLAQPELFQRREQSARAAWAAQPDAPPEYIALAHNFRSHPDLLAAMNRIFERILTPEVARIDYANGHALEPPPGAAASADLPGTPGDAPPTSLAKPFTGTPVEVHLVAMDGEDGSDDAADAIESPGGHVGSPEDAGGGPFAAAPAEQLSAVEQEAQVVAARIAALLAENRSVREKGQRVPLRPRHIAILLRTMKHKAMLFARALTSQGVPVYADLSSGFFDTPEVKDTLALLQVLDNPQQDIPLATVLLGPYGQFTHDDLAHIRLAFDRREVAFAQAALAYPLRGALEASARPVGALAGAPVAELGERLGALFARLERWRGLLRSRSLHEGLAEIFGESKILAYVAGLDTGAQRVANLQLLHQRALKFATFKKQGLHRFLRFIEKLRERENAGIGGGDFGEAPVLSEASDVVRILSVHKSKGLEFPVVFVSGLGGKLQLTPRGPVLLHPDLGVGLYVSDVERNVTYPSAAALRIAQEQRRSLRAEELRLLYVALTRARECLILTGHLAKAAEIDQWRQAWEGHRGPLPEDVLLQGARALDWLMPALATGRDVAQPGAAADADRMALSWDAEHAAAGGAQVVVHCHVPAAQAAAAAGTPAPPTETAARILAGLPLENVAADGRVERMIQRVTGQYAFADVAQRPAVQTVSFLKSAEAQRDAAGELAAEVPAELAAGQAETSAGDDAALQSGDTSAAEAARLRGVATHRVLELLDLAHCDAPAALRGQIDGFLMAKRLNAEEAERADLDGIGWFLWASAAGARMVRRAREIAAGNSPWQIRREIAFAWLAGAGTSQAQPGMPSAPGGGAPGESADQPTIRGVIDLLAANTAARAAEIIDYKTDSARLWELRRGDYQRQMQYYLAAASDILGFPVAQATLVFLSPRTEIVVPGAR